MSNDINKEVSALGSKYDNLDVRSAVVDEEAGTLTMDVAITGGPTAPQLPRGVEIVSTAPGTADLLGKVSDNFKEKSALRTIYQDPMSRSDLDLLDGFNVLSATPQQLYQKSIDYYKCKDIYGASINVLSNFASKGFHNDIDDLTIRNFFDSWVIDTNFEEIVEKIFFDFFRVGLVRTYKILGKYEPSVNHLGSKPGKKAPTVREDAAKKNRFSKSFLPIAYTILNPTMVEIKGSLMFGQTVTYLRAEAGKEIKELLEIPKKDLTTFDAKLLKNLPADWKKAAKDGKPIPLDQDLIGAVDYRRMPYERYPIPRATRVFESIQFKDELRKADYSTLDGITNYILKITVGNDENPVTKQETLERVGEMFDTVSKSFKVVWNHTLDVEKVTTPEVGQILGQDKYLQVNEDITGGLGVVRALLDGNGKATPASAELASKALIEEINYARRQVTRWIYSEYRNIATAMGFDKIPKVRFDDMALRDEIQMMTIVQGMIDRRIISYKTGHSKLGFDTDTEIAQMKEELALVEEGVLGIVGSPFQQSAKQDVQGTPKGTPSEGRPKGRPAPTPKDKDETKPKKVDKPKTKASFNSWLEDLSLEDLEGLIKIKREIESNGSDE
jgi:hypothetical protein